MKGSRGPLAILTAGAIVLAACGGTAAPSASPSAAASAAPSAAATARPAASPTLALGAKPANYPTKAITIVTGSSPGGGMDVFSRQLAEAMKGTFPQPLVVENKSGAGGANSLNDVVKRAADGYGLVTTTAGTCILTPYLQGAPLTCDSFDPVARIQGEDYYLFVRQESPLKTVDDFVAMAKTKKPKIAGAWFGTLDSFVPFVFSQEAKFDFDYVPFEGSGDALVPVLGGTVDGLVANVSEVMGQLEAKKIRMLAISAAERSKDFPDVPTFKEKGWNVVVVQWRGFLAPKGTSIEIREYLAAEFKKGMELDGWKKFVGSSKSKNWWMGPTEFGTFMKAESALYIGLMDKYKMKDLQKK